jgi:hypothetical protein
MSRFRDINGGTTPQGWIKAVAGPFFFLFPAPPSPGFQVYTVSEYILLGTRGAACRWKARGWIGSSGAGFLRFPLLKDKVGHGPLTSQR